MPSLGPGRGPTASRWGQIAVALAAAGLAAASWTALPGVPAPILALGLAFLPAAVWVLLRAPLVLVIAFVCFSLFRIHEVILPLEPLRLPLLLSLGALAGFGLMLALGRAETRLTPELGLLMGFAALVTVQIPFAVNPSRAFGYWIDSYSKIVLMAVAIAWMVRTPAQVGAILRVMTVIGAGIAAVAVWNSVNGIGLVEGSRVTINRAQGSQLGDPNDLAMVLLFPIGFATSFLLSRSSGWRDRAMAGLALPLLIWGLLATQSRGGLLGLLVVFAVFAWGRVRNKLLLLGGAALAGGVLFALSGIGSRAVVQEGGGATAIDASAQGRLDAWQAALNMALDKPWHGVGIDNFTENFFFYTPHWGGLAKAVHSTWFQVLAETGFPGIVLFVALVLVTFRGGVGMLRRLRGLGTPEGVLLADRAEALVAALSGFMVAATFLTQAFTWPLYLLIALLVATRRIADTLILARAGVRRPTYPPG